MDIANNQGLFQELSSRIKQQADKSLTILLTHANEIENFLKDDFFSNIIVSDVGQSKSQLNSKIKSVQSHLHDFLETVEHLTLSLELEIPQYNDGNDFRVVIQNEILDEIATMKSKCIAYLNQILEYREQRATANKELFKRPNFDDNLCLISNLDIHMQRNLKLMLIELKSDILRIFNMFTKNKDLIKSQSHRQHISSYF